MLRNAYGIYLLPSCLGTVRLSGQANSSLSTSYQHPQSLLAQGSSCHYTTKLS